MELHTESVEYAKNTHSSHKGNGFYLLVKVLVFVSLILSTIFMVDWILHFLDNEIYIIPILSWQSLIPLSITIIYLVYFIRRSLKIKSNVATIKALQKTCAEIGEELEFQVRKNQVEKKSAECDLQNEYFATHQIGALAIYSPGILTLCEKCSSNSDLGNQYFTTKALLQTLTNQIQHFCAGSEITRDKLTEAILPILSKMNVNFSKLFKESIMNVDEVLEDNDILLHQMEEISIRFFQSEILESHHSQEIAEAIVSFKKYV